MGKDMVASAAFRVEARASSGSVARWLQGWLPAWLVMLAAWLLAMVWLIGQGGDLVIADALYAAEGGRWAWRDEWLTVNLIHTGGKHLSFALWLGIAVFTAVIWRREGRHAWRVPLTGLLTSVLLSNGLVAVIKYNLPMECPWHLQRYGGVFPYIGLLQPRPAGMPANACFPAAHASTGFAWIALYFFFIQVRPYWRWAGLAFGLLLGGVFAFSQELRGAHFVSHDLTTLMLCWSVALGVFLLGRRLHATPTPAAAEPRA